MVVREARKKLIMMANHRPGFLKIIVKKGKAVPLHAMEAHGGRAPTHT
jgi:hypothetical protein